MPCPWPDEPLFINEGTPSFAIKHGGELTRSLVQHASERGYLDAGDLDVYVCVRCSYLNVGEHQHIRDEWHFDQADQGWLYVDGVAPTEVKFAMWNRTETVPLRTLFPYHGMEHRSPRTSEAGWRYFFRILHVAPGHRDQKVQTR
jgi:hypothetical protein